MASAQFTGPFVSGPGGFTFSLSLDTNFTYRIQAATNLAARPILWTDLTNFTARQLSVTFTDHSAATNRMRFYRVISP